MSDTIDFDFVFETSRQVGLGKGFAPSAASAAKSLGITVRQDKHPPGNEGTNFSLNEMGKFIRDGRNDPRVRAWAGKVLLAAGRPATTAAKAQAILNAIRTQVLYEQDPVNTEMMVKPHVTLCLGKDLCMPVGDCDDLVICFCSAIMSLGYECRIVGAAYNTERATHVLCAVLDEKGNWLYVDPSHPTYPVGKSFPASKEWVVDPISGKMSSGGTVTTLGKEPEHGDFIGVGAVPVDPAEPVGVGEVPVGVGETQVGLGETPGEAGAAGPTGVGIVPFAHAFSPLTHGASYVPVGLEGGFKCFPDGTENKPAQREPAFAGSQCGCGLFPVGEDE